ncbi:MULTISPECIES: GDYXXLXY domain-containing protein [unclassified Marinobacter]|uniref:GDYXXLXY domain-containing protein n=1 Tax=unclassified Marinobacter TaxID=83889 RepID=UPI00269D2AE1|nr:MULTISPECIES: GDYXXLXY domain-containing protein [unclassified Marinobacter]
MLLLTPFALIGRFAPLWVLWAVLVNFALTLYFQPNGRFSTEAYGQLLWVQFATNAFFFQEGDAEYYEAARYGQFWVNEQGEPLLAALYNDDLKQLGPPEKTDL